ncbi:MAG: GMC family oxidoreductase [Deltaproteobacteria bacterium]|nr:GMC family oxidoreductase [Deltaproteobacteria bacterium]
MTGQIVDLSATRAAADAVVDVLVVGSGCGGATAARTLAQAGRDVLVLEEGGDFTGRQLTQRDGAMYDQLYMDRAGRSTSDLSISVMQGRVLGGGGVINTCDVVPIGDATLETWRRRFGLTDFTTEALAPHRARALRDLAATPIPEAALNANNRLLRQGTEALGWRGEVMLNNRLGCAGLGTCLIGCPANAKRNPRFVAIPQALEAGARFWTRARALRLEGASGELKTVELGVLDPRGHRVGEHLRVRARTVILAANAIESAALLIRSGLGNEHVGRHLSLQPQLPIVARFDHDVIAFRGIPQAYGVTEFEEPAHPEHGWWGFRIESISGTPGIVGTILPWLGEVGKERMRDYPRFASALQLFPDEPSGRVRVERSGRLRIDYTLGEELLGRARAAIKASARIYLAAGARDVVVVAPEPLLIRRESDLGAVDGLRFEPATMPWISAHQQGTVRFAPSQADGGADPAGQVYGTRGVYVFDSSGFPTSSSSHTMAPILTVSEHLSQRLLATLPS